MNFIIYLMLFFFVNQLMYISPMLGILCYIGFIAYMFSSYKRKVKSFQSQQGYQKQQHYQDPNQNNTNQSSSQSDGNQKTRNDAIDVEFTEEEL